MKYYIHDGQNQQGPFTLDELREKSIKKTTTIWRDGLSDWTTADQIDELKEIIQVAPPAFIPQTPPKHNADVPLPNEKPKSNKRFSLFR